MSKLGKLERQQKKLEALQAKEELKEQKRAEREAKKAEKAESRASKRGKKPKKPKFDKKVSLKAERLEKPTEETEFQPKSSGWKKVLAIILWLIIAFFVAQGLLAVLNRESSEDLKKTMDKHYGELSERQVSQMEAGTFTASFLQEFFHYEAENDTWNERVGKYLASGVVMTEPGAVDLQRPVNIEIRKVTVNKDNIDVDAYAEVEYHTTVTDGEETIEKDGVLKHYVRVPIITKDGNFAVVSTPIYMSDTNHPAQIEYSNVHLNGDSVDSKELQAIQPTVENFLKAYYGKKPSELKYYVTKNFGSIATVGGTMKFVSLDNCQAVKARGGYTVMTTAVLNNGFSDVSEVIILEMVKGEENRLYVNAIKTRQ